MHLTPKILFVTKNLARTQRVPQFSDQEFKLNVEESLKSLESELMEDGKKGNSVKDIEFQKDSLEEMDLVTIESETEANEPEDSNKYETEEDAENSSGDILDHEETVTISSTLPGFSTKSTLSAEERSFRNKRSNMPTNIYKLVPHE